MADLNHIYFQNSASYCGMSSVYYTGPETSNCLDCLHLWIEAKLSYSFPETKQGRRVHRLMFVWWEEFNKKNKDYQTSSGNVSENFGVLGQYMKLTDKIHKLRKSMYDGEIVRHAVSITGSKPNDQKIVSEFNFEGTEEILRDIIGHCFLALDFIEERNNK